MKSNDHLGYYEALGVTNNATQGEIKAAYRSKAMDLHPDRNIGIDTTSKFQQLQTAYDIISNEKLRSQYDADSSVPPTAQANEEGTYQPLEPIVCARCSKITAKPNYKVFYSVFSYFIGASRTPHQGIFCSQCEIKVAVKASTLTIIFGWWSIPGFLWSIHALLYNLIGGTFKEQNARLHGYQAFYFAQNGNEELSRAIAIDALSEVNDESPENNFYRKLKKKHGEEYIDPLAGLRTSLEGLIASFPKNIKIVELNKSNKLFNRRFFYQALILISLITLITGENYRRNIEAEDFERARLEKLGIERERAQAIAAKEAEALKRQELPLPTSGIYKIKDKKAYYAQQNPPFKIINSPDANTLLKLIRISDGVEVISIFVRANEELEITVPIGKYKVKIANGQTWYGDAIRFGPNTGYAVLDSEFNFRMEGNELLGHRVRLMKMKDGNLKQIQLNASEF